MYGRLLHFVLMSGKTYHLRTAQISLAASVNITAPHGARKSNTKRKRTNEPREVRVFAPPSKSRERGDRKGGQRGRKRVKRKRLPVVVPVIKSHPISTTFPVLADS